MTIFSSCLKLHIYRHLTVKPILIERAEFQTLEGNTVLLLPPEMFLTTLAIS